MKHKRDEHFIMEQIYDIICRTRWKHEASESLWDIIKDKNITYSGDSIIICDEKGDKVEYTLKIKKGRM